MKLFLLLTTLLAIILMAMGQYHGQNQPPPPQPGPTIPRAEEHIVGNMVLPPIQQIPGPPRNH